MPLIISYRGLYPNRKFMKKHSLFLLIITVFFIPFIGSTQNMTPKQLLKKTDKSLKDIHTVVYKINLTKKNFFSKDTLKTVALCSLDLTSQNKTGKYYNYIISKRIKDDIIAYEKYDGVFNSEVYYKTDSDSLKQQKRVFIYNSAEIDYGLVNNNLGFMCLNLFYKKESFTKYKSFFKRHSSVQEMEVKQEVLLGIPVYELTITGKNKNTPNSINNWIDKYYIRKTDFLPIAYSSYGEFEGIQETEYAVIEYIEINPNISLETFEVDTTQTLIVPKALYEHIQKYGL